MAAPAVGVVVLVAVFPLLWTFWESLHLHDLRAPASGRPFVGAENYIRLAGDPRFRSAALHTGFFVVVTVTLEMLLGLLLALGLDRITRARGAARTVVLLPWAVPTVVAGLVWRFAFEGRSGFANRILMGAGVLDDPLVWFAGARSAWVPLIVADVWKTTPFVALLLLAGLQTIPVELDEAARIDGAGPWRRFREVTLPLLAPALLVAVLFRALDALRVFDLVYVLTGGGPGAATEPLSLYAFQQLLQNLRFGYGSAASISVFFAAFLVALLGIRLLGRDLSAGSR
jgi:ABC-type sugar transport system permease subunit